MVVRPLADAPPAVLATGKERDGLTLKNAGHKLTRGRKQSATAGSTITIKNAGYKLTVEASGANFSLTDLLGE